MAYKLNSHSSTIKRRTTQLKNGKGFVLGGHLSKDNMCTGPKHY